MLVQMGGGFEQRHVYKGLGEFSAQAARLMDRVDNLTIHIELKLLRRRVSHIH